MFKGLVDPDGKPAQLMVGDTIYIRRSDRLVRISLRENEKRMGGIARAKGLKLTRNGDSHINFFVSTGYLSTEEVAILLVDILAIVGISIKLVENSHHGLLYQVESVGYADRKSSLKARTFVFKKPLSSKAPGDFDLFGFINREM